MRRLSRSGLVAAVLLHATLAGAEPPRAAVVVVAADPTLALPAAQLSGLVEDAVKADKRLVPADLGERADREGSEQRAAAAAQGRADYELGLKALDSSDAKLAVEAFTRSVAAYERADLTREIRGLLDARAMRAVALSQRGDLAGAKKELAAIFDVGPTYAFEPKRMSAKLNAAKQEVLKKARKAKRTTLDVRSTPVPADVWVDGFPSGMTPVQLKDLAPAEHYVTLVAPGFSPVQGKLRAGSGQVATLELTPAAGSKPYLDLLAQLRIAIPAGAAGATAAKLAAWADADQALVIHAAPEGKGLKLTGARVRRDGTVLATGELQLAAREGAALGKVQELVALLLAGPSPESAPLPAGEGAPLIGLRPSPEPDGTETEAPPEAVAAGPKSDGLSRSTYGVIVGGAGLAAGIGGAVMGLSASGKADDARATPQPDQAGYDALASSAQSTALVADVLYGVAAVGLGIGTYLLLSDGDGGGSGGGVSAGVAPTGDGAAAALAGSF